AAVDEPRLLRAIGERPARNVLVVRLVGLAQVGGIRVRLRAVRPHPVHGGAGVEAAREGDADLFALGKRAQYLRQRSSPETAIISDPAKMPRRAHRALASRQ